MSTRRRRPSPFALAFIVVVYGCEEGAAPTSPPADAVLPAATAGELFFRSVATGQAHACGVTTDDRAFCWGLNGDGQLGDGTRTNRSQPVEVKGGLRFMTISASEAHTCGVTTDSLVYCWGSSSNGQLGNGSLGHQLVPAKAGSRHYKLVTTGGFYSCATTDANRAYCWGKNSQGQLGDGTTTQRLSPVPVAGSTRFYRLSAGAAHTCGLTTARKAYCWGDNGFRKLGDGSTADMRLVPAAVAGGHAFRQVSAGNGHTCGLDVDRHAYCWGSNNTGQLGDGTRTDRPTPHLVAGGRTYGQVVAGGTHSTGVSTDHAAFAWGDNFAGKLGDGTMVEERLVPTRVAGGISFAGVDPGGISTCGVNTVHRAYCWGQNAFGQLGIGITDGPQICEYDIPCATRPQAVVHLPS